MCGAILRSLGNQFQHRNNLLCQYSFHLYYQFSNSDMELVKMGFVGSLSVSLNNVAYLLTTTKRQVNVNYKLFTQGVCLYTLFVFPQGLS